MEKRIIDKEIEQALYNDKFFIRDGVFYKRSLSSENKMVSLDEASVNFSYDVYMLAKYLLYISEDNYIGFAMDHYVGYETIYSLLYRDAPVKWDIILKKLILAYLELRANGFLYTDFHDKNIIIMGDDFRITDMDSVTEMKKGIFEHDLVVSIWCLMDLIVEVYFYNDHIPGGYVFDSFMMQIEDKGLLTKKTNEFLMSILNKENILPGEIEKMIDPLIQEFSDPEKNNEIRKILIY